MAATPRPGELLVLALAVLVRLVPILTADRMTADVLRYHKVAENVLEGKNPYELPRLYPYPPVWVWFETGSEWLARRIPVGFPVLVKLPVLCADALIVALLLLWAREGRAHPGAALLYALHPVSILVTGFHGQFDAMMLLSVLLALHWFGTGRPDGSALALAAAIALKSFPLLLLPFFLAAVPTVRGRIRYAALATAPVALLLLPYAFANLPALTRELFGYGGIADFGWIALLRGVAWLRTGTLPRSEAQHWGALIPAAKLLFLTAYGAMLALYWRGRLRWTLPEAAIAVFLAFQVFYGAVSAQYLLWVVPLAVLRPDRYLAAHSVTAVLALVGFYAFLAPGVLQGDPPLVPYASESAGRLWVLGVGALLAAGLVWLVALVRRVAPAPRT